MWPRCLYQPANPILLNSHPVMINMEKLRKTHGQALEQ